MMKQAYAVGNAIDMGDHGGVDDNGNKVKEFISSPGGFLIAENILLGGDQDTIDFLSNLGITPAYSTFKRQKSDLIDSRDLPDNGYCIQTLTLKRCLNNGRTL